MNILRCKLCNIVFSSYRSDTLFCCSKHAHKGNYIENMLNPEWRLKKLISMAKNRAKKKNLSFDLDIDFLLFLWYKNKGSCSLTGIPFILEPMEKLGQVNPRAPSIDRIAPELGYTKENIRLITYHMNVALSEYGIEEFEKLVTNYKSY